MNNEELKKKIEDILEEYNFETDDGEGWVLDTEEMADALIAAGIVADVQSLADGNCVLYVKGKGFMRLYNEQDINEMMHRAEVAESELERYKRALHSACINLIKDEEDNVNMELLAHVVCTKFLRNAEKELAKEERK